MQACAQQMISTMASSSNLVQSSARRSSVAPVANAAAMKASVAAKPFGSVPSLSIAMKSRRATLQVAHAAQAEVGKLISKVEIPAFIPRSDLIDQLLRWAIIEVQENGMGNVTPYSREGLLWGFTVSFLKDGVSATDIRVAFDEEIALKHEWVGRGVDGFPLLEGNSEEVDGKNFEIRKVDETPVSEPIRASVRDFCQMLVAAINKYYAFGSCFVDDST